MTSLPAAAPRREKRLILCLDGTWNSGFEEVLRRDKEDKVMKPTNALKITRAILPFDEESGMAQIVYYDLGVGALAEYPGTANKVLHTLDRTLGGAWGAGFEGNVEDALNFLVHNYRPGDEVFIFGFSRGAAQARAVTHFLDWNNGLPEKCDAYYLPKLFREYVMSEGRPRARRFEEEKNEEIRRKNEGKPPDRQRALIKDFRRVRVRYLGVWDTVMALGSRLNAVGEHTSVKGRTFFLQPKPAECVEHARHAIAIDERRYDFRPEIWQGSREGQVMEQRWFAGVHTNVGGGYGYDSLANLALHWIKKGATDEGLCLDEDFLRPYEGEFFGSMYESYTRFYDLLDKHRDCSGQGARCLTGYPPAANFAIDDSVFDRMNADPQTLRENGDGTPATAYRPRNVIEYLAEQPDVPPLPADVLSEINVIRRRRGLPHSR